MISPDEQRPIQARSRIHKRLRKAVTVLASLLLLYVTAGVVFNFLIWHEIRRIRREGDPVTLAQRIPPMPSDAENGAVIYEKAFHLIKSKKFAGLYSLIYKMQGSDDSASWAKARAESSDFVPVVELAREAASKPCCSFGADWKRGLFHANPKALKLTTLLCAYALILAHDGDKDAALSILELAVRVGNSVEDSNTYLSFFIRDRIYREVSDTAYKIILSDGVDENIVRSFSDALAGNGLEDDISVMLRCERATRNSDYQEIARSCSLSWEEYESDSLRNLRRFQGSIITRPVLLADRLHYLYSMRRTINDAVIPFRKLPAPKLNGQPCDCRSRGLWLSEEFEIDPYSCRRFIDSSKARINGTRTAMALCVYKDQFGKYPQSLSDLSKLGWKLDLEDPFSGKDFVYKPQPNGFLLYSLGPDLKDNDGRPDKQRPVPQEGYDLVWHVAR